ncbi:hypothetical protein LguiA_009689 [Lonicera macranthoides]
MGGGGGGSGKEALVACGDKSLGVGITVWDIETGDHLLHIPTCASSPNSLICLRNQYLVASQIHKPASVAAGVIFTWPLNKLQKPLRNYPVETVGPLSCTSDGIYLAGGTPSGNIYIWEVTTGRLLKKWRGHNVSLTSLAFSNDCSLFISGSEDGMIVIWSMISLLDETECGRLPPLLSFSTEHMSFVTSLLSPSRRSSSIFLSSSLDGTCKVWDVITGTLLQTKAFPTPITAIVLDRAEKHLFSGTADGRIFVNAIDFRFVEDTCFSSGDQQIVLNGHKEAITALTFSSSGLISTSEDCTACLWDVINCVVVRRFNHQKGSITNLLVIPQSSLIPMQTNQRGSTNFRVSLLDKYPKAVNLSEGTITLVPSSRSLENQNTNTSVYRSTDLMNRQRGTTPAAIQLKIETNIENRVSTMRMAKHMMEMNNRLRASLLKLAQSRLLQNAKNEKPTNKKRKRLV